jgi:hypothetical protein
MKPNLPSSSVSRRVLLATLAVVPTICAAAMTIGPSRSAFTPPDACVANARVQAAPAPEAGSQPLVTIDGGGPLPLPMGNGSLPAQAASAHEQIPAVLLPVMHPWLATSPLRYGESSGVIKNLAAHRAGYGWPALEIFFIKETHRESCSPWVWLGLLLL